MSESEIIETVEKAKKPGTFKIVEAIQGRGYPEEEIEIFLDESIAYIATQLDESIKELNKKIDKHPELDEIVSTLNEERDRIISEKEKIVESMGESGYKFLIRGISEGDRQDLYEKCLEKYPMEYENERNPFTGDSGKREVENPKRDRYFTELLWQKHIVRITNPDGEVQEGINYDEAVELRRSLPLASITKITTAIENIRTATAVFMMSVNEDFLAKS